MASRKSKAESGAGGGGIYLYHGSDEAEVKRAAAAKADELRPDDEMNYEVLDGRAESVDDAVSKVEAVRQAILTLPFFGGGKVVWWKNVSFLDDSVIGRSASVKESLERLQGDLVNVDGQSVTLLVSALALHKGRAFGKALLKVADSKCYDLPDLRRGGEDAVVDRIEEVLRQVGLKPGTGAAERLYQAVGMNFGQLRAEVEKLVTYLGGEGAELSREDVQTMVGGKRDVLVWDFCDAVIAAKPKLALSLLNALIGQGESEVGILILLAGTVRQAALASTLMEAGQMTLSSRGGSYVTVDLTPEAEAVLPRKKSGEPISTYNLGRIARLCKHRPAAFWRQAVEVLHEANLRMLTGAADKVRTLEGAVLKLA